MTPAAKAIIIEVVQTLKQRMISPQYVMLMRAITIGSVGTGIPDVIYQRDLMLLGSVLLPEEPADDVTGIVPAFYLDDPLVRTLIREELQVSLREFAREAHASSWRAYIGLPGSPWFGDSIPRRFYRIDYSGARGWIPTPVPWQSEKDAEDSTVPVDATVLPDFGQVTDQMRYSALGI